MEFDGQYGTPWRELHRRMAGRPVPVNDRSDSSSDTVVPFPGRTPAPGPTAPTPPAPPHRPARGGPAVGAATGWAELHVHTSYSFLDGASDPADLVDEAVRLGIETLAVTDHDGLYAAAVLAGEARRAGLRTVFGAELTLGAELAPTGVPDQDGEHLLVLARGPEGYRRLAQVIGDAHLAGGSKRRPSYDRDRLADAHGGHWAILTGCRKGALRHTLETAGPDAAEHVLRDLADRYGPDNVHVELTDHHLPGDDQRNDALADLAARTGLPLVATTAAHHASPAQLRLAQALAALRQGRSLADAEPYLAAAGTAHLRSPAEMAARLAPWPGVQQATVELGRELAFDFRDIKPELPGFPVPDGHSEASWLRELTLRAAASRFDPGNQKAQQQIDYELEVITNLDMAGYFLIVHDIVDFCRRSDIWCQGRGSAANSAVCYALGITSVDPIHYGLLFERFLSPERDGPPDIDLDIESRRREEAIQYVYERYGRTHAAQVANVITYQPRLAVRDAGRALGYAAGDLDRFARETGWEMPPPDAPVPQDVRDLAHQLRGLPRHLGIHSGGMVLTRRPIAQTCPTEWASMPGRSILQWDKDSVAAAGLVKIDLLGLGMLSALHDACDLIDRHYRVRYTLATIPPDDPAVYDMLCRADSVGVFQVESRAQASALPRLRPRTFYDLVVQVALIRPGPIQGGSVHPYIARRNGREKAVIAHPLMERALGKTLGVPLFQEQMMQLAIDCAGFTPGEADRLRQAMGSKRSHERVAELRDRLLAGMHERGIPQEVAVDVYGKIEAFSNYGFPESHAASFALLVYASAWLKLHYPAAFTCALLANQPMGFYSPTTLIQDVRRRGVTVLAADVNHSSAQPTLEPEPAARTSTTGGGGRGGGDNRDGEQRFAIRLGLADVRNLGDDQAEQIAAGRPYADLEDFARRTRLPEPALEALATAGAFRSLGLSRRQALWSAGALACAGADTLPGTAPALAPDVDLPAMTPVEETIADLWATGTSVTAHPVQHARAHLQRCGALTAADLKTVHAGGEPVAVGGLVTHRQRPPTAGGVLFLSLEDETGLVNVIVQPHVLERHRRAAMQSAGLLIHGTLERRDGASNLVATRLTPLTLAPGAKSRDFR
ncbi:error-prone DNA polymerase [Streptomyces sp. TLI_171]|uniref:error-prone DNA polymerase n=1 Tax=Streptomyces sp. TLI_171 TaxID=1938859 RepID=UPI000C18ABC1|nr:error-prone DNA polymerase [Streptomyces sp. TLI_171]RKE02899.1 DnaE-like error-prone DNA polymerase [Streptomyces sp. TLI_171]